MGKNCILIDRKFDSEPFYEDNNKYIRVKLKMFGDDINTNFLKGIILKHFWKSVNIK